jgi:hypothetical protein
LPKIHDGGSLIQDVILVLLGQNRGEVILEWRIGWVLKSRWTWMWLAKIVERAESVRFGEEYGIEGRWE